jgi:hypothetical protein
MKKFLDTEKNVIYGLDAIEKTLSSLYQHWIVDENCDVISNLENTHIGRFSEFLAHYINTNNKLSLKVQEIIYSLGKYYYTAILYCNEIFGDRVLSEILDGSNLFDYFETLSDTVNNFTEQEITSAFMHGPNSIYAKYREEIILLRYNDIDDKLVTDFIQHDVINIYNFIMPGAVLGLLEGISPDVNEFLVTIEHDLTCNYPRMSNPMSDYFNDVFNMDE